jgi:hypothetical protein
MPYIRDRFLNSKFNIQNGRLDFTLEGVFTFDIYIVSIDKKILGFI